MRHSSLLRSLSLLLLSGVPGIRAQSVDLGPIVNPANGHTYYRLSPSSWTAAEGVAVGLGGHLVTVNDAQENTWVFNTFSRSGQYGLWIGLNDVANEGQFVWASGQVNAFSAWASGQPDNWNPAWHPEDYGMIFVEEGGAPSASRGRWNDLRDVQRENLPTSNTGGWLQGVVEVHPVVDLGPIVNPANGHTYYRLSPSSWTSAENVAIALGGHLVTVNDAQENAWVFNTFSQSGQYGLWIGLNDVANEGQFVWASGQVNAFRAWASAQPDNWNSAWHPEDYGMIFVEEGGAPSASRGRWNDLRDVQRENLPINTTGGWLQGVVELDPNTAASLPYGAGCGNPPLSLATVATALPRINTTARALLTDIPSSIAFVAVGWSNLVFGPLPLPMSLAGFGMPGCNLLQSAESIGMSVTFTGVGGATFDQPLPNAPSLVGQHVYLQAFAFAPGVNPGQVILSNGLDWQIGH